MSTDPSPDHHQPKKSNRNASPRKPTPGKPRTRKRPNTKRTGERSEAAFLNRAAGLGFGVVKPWGDSLPYDFIAAHVIPLDIWYIVPVEICTPAPMLRFYPHRKPKKMRLEKYRESWRQLKPSPNPDDDTPITLYAVADETWRTLESVVILSEA